MDAIKYFPIPLSSVRFPSNDGIHSGGTLSNGKRQKFSKEEKVEWEELKERLKNNYDGNYQKYLRSSYWQTIKKAFFAKKVRKCLFCKSTEKLHLHHRFYKDDEGKSILFRDWYALIPLCNSCHSTWHALFGTNGYRRIRTKHFKRVRRLLHLGVPKRQALYLAVGNPILNLLINKKLFRAEEHKNCDYAEKCKLFNFNEKIQELFHHYKEIK